MTTIRTLATELRAALEATGDPDRAVQQRAYMKSSMPYAGVATPALRALTRRVFAAHPLASAAQWRNAVLLLWRGAAYREERYAAIGLARAKPYARYRTAATLPMLDELIVTGAWWDFVDEIAINLVGELLSGYPTDLRPVMLRWAADEDLWRRRSAILSQLKFKTATDRELLAATIEPAIDAPEFFLRKAIGWALREYSKTDPAFVIDFVDRYSGRLSGLSRREALRVLVKQGRIDAGAAP